jgi:hypothetical protein
MQDLELKRGTLFYFCKYDQSADLLQNLLLRMPSLPEVNRAISTALKFVRINLHYVNSKTRLRRELRQAHESDSSRKSEKLPRVTVHLRSAVLHPTQLGMKI